MARAILSRGAGVTITGFALIAVTYGLIRFAYGQFLPSIREDLGLTESMAGLISSALFMGNCAALLIAAYATDRFGGRVVATVAASLATTGLIGMSFAQTSIVFAGSLLLAGSSAGLSMPPLVAAIVETVRPNRHALATTIVNAGTSAGILISGPIALYVSGLWRLSFSGFAVLAVLTTIATLCVLPPHKAKDKVITPNVGTPLLKSPRILPILASAFLFGVVCSTFWTFGGEILSSLGRWENTDLNWYWIVIGAAGLAGAPAGYCVKVFGVRAVHTFSYMLLAIATILLGLSNEDPLFAVLAGAIFGFLYILQTGLYLVWGLREMPQRPATIVAAAFFMLPLGQVAGSILMGLGLQWLGTKETLFCFMLLCLMGALYIPRRRIVGAPLAAS